MRPHEMAGVTPRIPLKGVLGLGLRFPKVACGNDFGDRLARPQAGSIDVSDRVFGNPFLLFTGIEDCRPIAGADVVALAITRARVVNLEEELEELTVADALRIEYDFDRFGVVAMVVISRVRDAAAGVTDSRRQDAVVTANEVLDAPEAAAGENRAFLSHVRPPPGPSSFRSPRPPYRRDE